MITKNKKQFTIKNKLKLKKILLKEIKSLKISYTHIHKIIKENNFNIEKKNFKEYNKFYKEIQNNFLESIIYKSEYPLLRTYHNNKKNKKYQYHIDKIKIYVIKFKLFVDFKNFVIYTDKILDLMQIMKEIRHIIDVVYEFNKSPSPYSICEISGINFYNVKYEKVEIVEKVLNTQKYNRTLLEFYKTGIKK